MRQIISDLRYIHAAYNMAMLLIFFYHGSVGLRIRRARLGGAPANFVLIKRHRRLGPVIAPLGVLGYLVGVAIILLDRGHVAVYPLHFITGTSIASCLVATWLISRKIKGPSTRARNAHFILGLVILALYAVQFVLGAGILL